MRRTRQEILELFEACQTKLGKTPGTNVFCKATGVKPAEVLYYWPNLGKMTSIGLVHPIRFFLFNQYSGRRRPCAMASTQILSAQMK